MTSFPIHSRATAPAESKPVLDQAARALGYLPALLGQMAESPALLKSYAALADLFSRTSFTPAEQQLALLAISVENDAHYCTPAHTTRARETGLDEATIAAVRTRSPVTDPRAEALRRFTIALVRERGFLADAEVAAFVAAGFTRANVLDLILAVGMKTLSNYVNHLAETPLDPANAADAFAAGRRVA